jgi:hypothetical protein
MNKLLVLLLLCAGIPTGVTTPVTTVSIPSASSSFTIQRTINAAATGSTIVFSAGTYSINTPIEVPCSNNLVLTGPSATPATAILSATFVGQPILSMSNCSGVTIEYLGFANTEGIGVRLDPGTWGGITISHNQFTHLAATGVSGGGANNGPDCANHGNCDSIENTALLFASTRRTACPDCSTLTDTVITYNQFGDASSCLQPDDVMTGSSYDYGGNCAGMEFFTSMNGVTVKWNNFVHLEEGFHVLCGPTSGDDCEPPSAFTWSNFSAQFNDFSGIHRMGMEMQLQSASNVHIDHNSFHDPTSPFYATFGISNACCNIGATSPSTTNIDNILIANQPSFSSYIGMADEAWGNGAIYQNNLVEGYWANGFEWAYIPNGNITNNYICGPVLSANDTFITQESNPPTGPGIAISSNKLGANCSAIVSETPVIAQNTDAVTLSDSGQNHSIYYTVDGSNPTPFSKRFTGSFTPPAGATVKAVAMWGAANQPKSYPDGLGYVPSPVVSAVFKGGSGPRLATAYLVSRGGVKSIPVGGTLQFIAHGLYSDGTAVTLPDSEGDVVTAWNTSNHAVAKISSLGHVTAIGPGTTTIEGMIGTLKASTTQLTVTQAPAGQGEDAIHPSLLEAIPGDPGSSVGITYPAPLWQLVNPAGGSASVADGHIVLFVPGGSNHDLIPSNLAVRVLQDIGDTHFDVSIKIDSSILPADDSTSQGLMVLSDNGDFITFALRTGGSNIGLVAQTVTAGVADTVLDIANLSRYQHPMYLRLARTGSAYMAFYSTDGISWTQVTSFTDADAPAQIGPFASNYNSNPADAVPVVMSVESFNIE